MSLIDYGRWRHDRRRLSRIASEISPTVARARAASTAASSRLPLPLVRDLGQGRQAPRARLAGSRRRLVFFEPPDLALRGPRCCRYPECRIGLLVVEPVVVDADDDLLAAIDGAWRRAAASSIRRFGRPVWMALVMPPRPSTSSISAQAFVGEFRRQALDIIGAGQRIDDLGDAGLVLEDELGVAGDAGGEFRRQRDRLVEGIGVQRLRAAEHGRQRLDKRCG